VKRFYNKPKQKKAFTKLERRKLRSKARCFIRFVVRRDWKQPIVVTHFDERLNEADESLDKGLERSLKPLRIEYSYPKLFRLFGL